MRSSAVVDLAAIRASVATCAEAAGPAAVMAAVKADGYGHGLVASSRAALQGGATWLGVAFLEEALTLRAAGITAPILSWLAVPGEALAEGIRADVDLNASAPWMLDELVKAAAEAGRPARVHLKVDTGLSRGGSTPADWPDLVNAALAHAATGAIEVVGVWSHLVHADSPRHPTTDAQLVVFTDALAVAEGLGLTPQLRHLANSAATLSRPDTHFDLVRPGLAVYGLSPFGAPHDGLRPAMTLRSTVALTKRVPADTGVSYGHRYRTSTETTLALIPLGYADGIPRAATNCAPILLGGRRRQVAGTVCMDQFVLDVGDDAVEPGDEALLFGPGDRGEPTAYDWAAALGTISYEVVTRIGARVPREYVGEQP